MGAFAYTALDETGREQSGVLEGDTARQVRQSLRDSGLTPLSVDALTRAPATGTSPAVSTRVRRVSPAQLALLTRQLATLVRAGLPLEEALAAVAQQSERASVARVIHAVRAKVMEGHSLATGLDAFPQVFPDLYRATVAAGEQSGRLDLVLERLADYTENRQTLRQKVQLALIYPVILTLVAFGVVALLLAYVVPEVVQVFEDMGRELPWLTQALIATGTFVRHAGLWVLGGLVVAGFGLRALLRRAGPRRIVDRWILGLPLIGRLARGMNAARFARTLAILSASAVPVLEALRIAGEVIANVAMSEAVDEATRRVREGASLSAALGASGYMPPMLLHLIASGEQSGNLETMLERAADTQEREITTTVSILVTVFEPVLILVMAAMVLIIVLAILLPIFNLNQLVA